ncbi:MAG: VTT domain-containing protein [Kordiimonadaceae bacterium]|nr:VTT domain-containing protein [Kordiimonadaceae bacterium]MBO6570234.1 VTT domain-containing protein [Kordiimonadaceae bacterium]MBO6965668.1 VTT domain-containing protein [Kordiimonadaceae bacterium]
MPPLLRIMLILFIGFAATFLLIKGVTGLSFADVENWLRNAREISAEYVVLLVIALLVADLLVSVPTLTITLLSGFLLGQWLGAAAALSGLYLAGCLGYSISRQIGDRLLTLLLKEPAKRQHAIESFETHGFGMIILARAAPILPEVTACLAGATRMPFGRFLLAWTLNSVPYVLVATFAGSISTLDEPQPALFTALGISATLWVSWFFYRRRMAGPAKV